MSSAPDRKSRASALFVLLASLAALAWYGQGQLAYSLAFLYRLLRAVFPGLPAVEVGP
jgi:hypothetical protein